MCFGGAPQRDGARTEYFFSRKNTYPTERMSAAKCS